MKSLFSFATLAAALSLSALVAGCSSSDGAISLDTSETKLTSQADDALFVVKVDDARDDGYALEGLVVKVSVDGAAAQDILCTPQDTNTNKKLDKGESLKCTEGPTNIFDEKTVGKACKVELRAKIDDKDELVGDADWKP
jgi:hypothetical protein